MILLINYLLRGSLRKQRSSYLTRYRTFITH